MRGTALVQNFIFQEMSHNIQEKAWERFLNAIDISHVDTCGYQKICSRYLHLQTDFPLNTRKMPRSLLVAKPLEVDTPYSDHSFFDMTEQYSFHSDWKIDEAFHCELDLPIITTP